MYSVHWPAGTDATTVADSVSVVATTIVVSCPESVTADPETVAVDADCTVDTMVVDSSLGYGVMDPGPDANVDTEDGVECPALEPGTDDTAYDAAAPVLTGAPVPVPGEEEGGTDNDPGDDEPEAGREADGGNNVGVGVDVDRIAAEADDDLGMVNVTKLEMVDDSRPAVVGTGTETPPCILVAELAAPELVVVANVTSAELEFGGSPEAPPLDGSTVVAVLSEVGDVLDAGLPPIADVELELCVAAGEAEPDGAEIVLLDVRLDPDCGGPAGLDRLAPVDGEARLADPELAVDDADWLLESGPEAEAAPGKDAS